MRLSLTLTRYIARQFLVNIAIIMVVFTVLVGLIDAIETMRDSAHKNAPLSTILYIVFLKFPLTIQQFMAFVMLIATLLTYTKLSRTHELSIIRASGISVWQFLFPTVFTAGAIGVLMCTAFNPLATYMNNHYGELKDHNVMSTVSSDGLWLRQSNLPEKTQRSIGEEIAGSFIIHAADTSKNDQLRLGGVSIYVLSKQHRFMKRINANIADLTSDYWHLKGVTIFNSQGLAKQYDDYFLKTNLTINDIQQTFAAPESVHFWALPSFITMLEKSGFSSISHRLYWHNILASPLLFMTMVCIAALFSLRPPRQGKTGLLITASIAIGALAYFIMNVISSFGLSGNIPVGLSVWLPVMMFGLASVSILLQIEDG